MDIDPYISDTHWRATREGEWGGPPGLFENRKKCPNFEEKGPDCVNLWIKYSTQNVVLIVSRRKNSKMFPCGAVFTSKT